MTIYRAHISGIWGPFSGAIGNVWFHPYFNVAFGSTLYCWVSVYLTALIVSVIIYCNTDPTSFLPGGLPPPGRFTRADGRADGRHPIFWTLLFLLCLRFLFEDLRGLGGGPSSDLQIFISNGVKTKSGDCLGLEIWLFLWLHLIYKYIYIYTSPENKSVFLATGRKQISFFRTSPKINQLLGDLAFRTSPNNN